MPGMAGDRGHTARVLLSVAALAMSVSLAAAQSPGSPEAPSTAATYSFDIPSKSLAAAIAEVGAVSGWRIAYPFTLAPGRRSRALAGTMTPAEAVQRLLAGSGLSHRIAGPRSIVLVDPSQPAESGANSGEGGITLDPIVVEGDTGGLPPAFPGGQVAVGGSLGILGTRNVMDTPFNVVNYTSKTIEDQQSRTVADVTKNDPSVRTTWADGSYSNQFFIRGFPVANPDISINGLYGLVPYQMSGTSWVERVEILKGPSALLAGMPPQGSIGGLINLVTKRATDDPLTRLTLGYISDSQFGGKFDVSRRFGENKEFGVRFNAAYSNGNAPLDGQTNELGEAALALDYRGERVRLSADLGYQKNYSDDPARPIYARPGFHIPRAPKASSDLGQDWYYADATDVFGILRGEIDITDTITAYATAGAHKNDFLGLYNFSYLKNSFGDFDANNYYQPSYNDAFTGEAGVRAKVETGPIRHEITVSATGLYSELGVVAPVVSTYSSNIYNPGWAPFPNLAGRASKAPKTSAATLTSLAIADSLYAFDDRIQLILGARRQQIRQKGWNATTGLQTADYDEGATTPALGLVVKPLQNVSFYANYIEGLSQGPTAPAGSANVGEVFAPIKSKQYEAGVKIDFGRIATTLSAFQIEQPVGMLDTATNRYGLDGDLRNRGVEVNIFGEISDSIRLLGGAAFMDGVQTKTPGSLNDGKKAIGIPDVQVNLGAEWDLPFITGLTLTGRVIYTSSQYASADNTQSIPAWTRVDLGARYTFTRENGKPVTIRAGVENVFNRSYWAAASSNFGLARGAPRTYIVSTAFDF
jgi:iron complex outermembrane receptor protein